MLRILRAAGFAAAAVAFIAAAPSPSKAVNLDGAPAIGLAAHEAAQPGDGDLGLNGVEPAPFAGMFVHAQALVGKVAGAEAAPPPGAPDLGALVAAYAGDLAPGGEQDCLANAVYFEARSEPIEGQLAVAEVVMNRAASGLYPASLCGVVTQRAQFSFIRRGRFPKANKSSDAWRKAVAIAHIASERLAKELAPNILWYHAAYVSPRWGRLRTRETRIGLHIFYS